MVRQFKRFPITAEGKKLAYSFAREMRKAGHNAEVYFGGTRKSGFYSTVSYEKRTRKKKIGLTIAGVKV